MKHILALFLAMCMMLCMVACGVEEETSKPTQGNAPQTKPSTTQVPVTTDSAMPTTAPAATNKPTENTKPAHTHSFSDATCMEAAACACGEVKGSALGHTYNQGKCVRCGEADPDFKEQDTASKTVYVTETGKKYHSTKSCSGLSNAKAVYEATLTEAQSRNLGPCSKCY